MPAASAGPRYNGWRRVDSTDPDAGLSVVAGGKTRLTFGDNSTEITSEGAEPSAVVMGRGTSASPLRADIDSGNFLQWYFETQGDGSGDVRGEYLRLELSPTSGEALRAWTIFEGTGAVGVHGAHISASIAAGATVTGQVVGLRATLGAAAESRTLGGTLTALNVDSDIGANNTLPARTSMIRLTKSGSVDIQNFLDVADDQCLRGSGVSGSITDALPVIMPDGSTLYIPLQAAS